MATIDRVRAEYLRLNPLRTEQFMHVPEWTVAMANVIDEIVEENRRATQSLRRLLQDDAA